ncbi:MAG: right-handed parallel beta-helix repeat-containing protein, partial [Anaerolineales bacterium]|nr:right-handed parallel beta-helix repeat-containing protein [Anaerolineales bacterium]
TNSFGEANKVYVERGNYNNPGSPEPVTNLTVNGFAYTVMNDTFRAGAPNFTFYQITRSDAIDYAVALSTPEDSYVNQISNGHFWVGQNGSDSMTIEAAVDHAPDGSTINVLDGTYVEDGQVLVDTDITLIGAGKNDTIVKTNADTGTSGDSRAWFLVDANTSFDVSDLTFDGDGYKIYQAIRNKGEGSADNVKFVNIQYNASGPHYQGVAIAAFGTGPVDVTNSHFSEIGRIGVLYFGSGVNGSEFKNNTYVGKGAGDWLDYALDISNGAEVIVMGNDISNNKGVASSDGSNSAGILVSTFFGPGTTATITENDLYNNSSAIAVGYDGSDTSTVVANYNNITGNDNGIYSTAALVDGTRNWWGDASGPSGVGPGTGDSVDAETSYCPWLDDEFASGSASGGAAAQNTDTGEYFCSIQAAIDDSDTDAGDTIEVFAGTFNEQVEIDKNDLTLIGQGPNDTKLVSDVACTNTMNSSATAGVRLLGDHSGITLEGFSVSGYDLGLDIGENIGKTISDVTVKNVHANNNCVHGILSQAGNTDGILVENVTANDNGSGFFAGRGLWFINGTKADITIKDSSFNDNRLVGIDISDGDVTGLSITGNTVTGNGDSGIGVLGPQGPDNNLVDDNTVTDNGRYGIEIKNPSGTTTVSNNTVSLTGPGSDMRDYAGIAVFRRGPGATNADQPSGVTVTGNTVSGFAEPNGDGEGFGIVVEGTGMSVTENTVSGNDVGIQVQEGNPSPNTNGTDYFDRGDASVAATVVINNNNITGNTAGVRAVGTTNVTDGTINWWGDISGPSGEGTGSGDSVSANVTFCPWLDAAFPGGSPTTASGGFATTSTDGHTTKYCTIEEAMFASSGASQEVHVEEGNWPGEVMNRDYTDSPNLVVKAIGDRDDTVIDGITLTGAGFDGLKFTNFTITGDAPTPSGYDPGYAVEITNNGNYKNLAFVGNIFDGENVEDAAAIFSNRGWDGFLLDDNQFINFNDSPLTPLVDPYFANYSLVFMEAQVLTPAGRGNNYVGTNNVFDGITHSNALEAFRWQNVTMTGNEVTGTFGRLLVWSYAEDPLLNVNISDNEIEITAGNDVATSTGIGVYYAEADVNITGNKVTGANTCINTTGVTDLELTGNTLTDCAARGHYFSDSDLYVAPVSAVIENNVFDTSPAGVENAAQTFELNACHNIFIDITTKRFENPGPFVDCGALTITKFDDKNMNGVQDNGESALSGWTFDIYADDLLVTSETTDSNGQIVLEDFEYNDYEVCEQQKDGWKNTTDLCQDVTVAEDVPGSLSFGNFRMKLSPVLECVYTPQGSLTSYALYGYNNVDTDPVNQPIGGDNKFTPAPQDQGQPTEFATGRQVGVFWVPFTANNLVWTLKHPDSGLGGTATAGLGLNTCGDRLPTGTITIAKEVHDVPETPTLDFEFSGDLGAFSLAAGQSTTFAAVPIGSYDVKELVPANWGLGEINCEGGSTSAINNGVNIVLDVNDEV